MPARWEVSDKIALLRQHDNGVPWTRLAAESGVSLRTLSRWARAYRADSTSHGLARRQRSDHGRRRIPTELIEIVEALALAKPAPTVAFVHRRVLRLYPALLGLVVVQFLANPGGRDDAPTPAARKPLVKK